MGGAWERHTFGLLSLNGRAYLEDLGADGIIIFKVDLKRNRVRGHGMDSSGFK